ncbi:MAG TPA: hypothetical protein VF088_16860 [Pyrinomonadaceae bacterium]
MIITLLLILTFTFIPCDFVHLQTPAHDEDFEAGMKFYENTQFAQAAEAFKRSIKRDDRNARTGISS